MANRPVIGSICPNASHNTAYGTASVHVISFSSSASLLNCPLADFCRMSDTGRSASVVPDGALAVALTGVDFRGVLAEFERIASAFFVDPFSLASFLVVDSLGSSVGFGLPGDFAGEALLAVPQSLEECSWFSTSIFAGTGGFTPSSSLLSSSITNRFFFFASSFASEGDLRFDAAKSSFVCLGPGEAGALDFDTPKNESSDPCFFSFPEGAMLLPSANLPSAQPRFTSFVGRLLVWWRSEARHRNYLTRARRGTQAIIQPSHVRKIVDSLQNSMLGS